MYNKDFTVLQIIYFAYFALHKKLRYKMITSDFCSYYILDKSIWKPYMLCIWKYMKTNKMVVHFILNIEDLQYYYYFIPI